MNTARTPDLALIGAGYWGKNLARNFNELGVLATICDPAQATLGSYGSEYDSVSKTRNLDQILKDGSITKIAIAAPAALHYQIAKAALLAGKDVYVEKPICLDLQEGRELIQIAETEGRILMVGHLLQYHPCIEKLKELIAQGELGKLYYITSNRLNLGKFRQEENALWSFAPHDISVILSLAGNVLPERVRSLGQAYLTNDVSDTTLTNLEFASGLRGHVYVSWLNPFKEQKLTVVGSHGMAVFDDTRSWPEKLVLFRDYLIWKGGQVPTPKKADGTPVAVEEAEPLRAECLHFLDCCAQRKTARTDGQEGLRVLQVLQAAQRSLESNGESERPEIQTSTPEQPDYYAHPTSVIDLSAAIGKGSKIWHFAHISSGAKIGERCIFGQNTFVAADVVIGSNVKVQNNVSIYTGTIIEDDVFLGPSCVLTNVSNPRSQVNRHTLYEQTVIRKGATVGANATIICGVTLGRYCFVSAGAVVTKDVPDYAWVVGVPAKIKGWMSRHGHPLVPGADGTLLCPESGFRYFVEASTGGSGQTLRCTDLDEDAPLPPNLAVGQVSYRNMKRRTVGA